MRKLQAVTALAILFLVAIAGAIWIGNPAPQQGGQAVTASMSPNLLFDQVNDLKQAEKWDAY
ncbi:MAG: hypothetical protein JWL62_2448 [Hyphomicrobiales bacterium]|jgi:hypothetical protein|nr:hypothetical protein [Hyphomicrobiales bacterium]